MTFDMDVTRFAALILFVYMSASAEVEYISPEKTSQLEGQFDLASFDLNRDKDKLQNHVWVCDMFGARSHMQVQHGLKLYSWKDGWKNSGAQLVDSYQADGVALTGRKDRFEDQVKLTKDGLLVSRLLLVSAKPSVVAYSVCKTL